MATGPGDEPAAVGRDRLRAGHADREQVIEMLKTAFVDGRLTRDEFGARAGQALTARTCADLAALTADLPPGSAVARPARRPAPGRRRRPLAGAAAGSGGCLVIAAGAVWAAFILDPGPPGPTPYHSWAPRMLLIAFFAVLAALGIFGFGVAASLEQRRARRQLPPRPGPGGHALESGQHGGTGHGSGLPDTGQACVGLRAHKPPQRIPARAARTPRGVRPAQGTAGIPAPIPTTP
jgi:DUF1707 SHOCT-like domain